MQMAKDEIARLEKIIEKIDKFQKHAPRGCLKYQNKGQNTYFYQQYMNERTKKWDRKYIKKDNISLARRLAQKHYYSAIKPIVEKNVKELKDFVKRYCPERVGEIYDGLSDERKKLIMPMLDAREERIRMWYEEEYEKNNAYPENLRYETEQGELVRSKSEVIIANILHQYRDDLLYKYECPLNVMVAGKPVLIYPDFKILNVHTGKITYWEHAGLMDEPSYAKDFVRKANTYISNDLLPGREVVFTYETSEKPLDISVIKRLVDELRK